ncbi:hypothetical protein CDAR_256101 [Caerostris darwini]|uniref:Paramyosin n=1 Tax=Caerostris darwini TaxID=1538125 RepID=A0AAV4PT66_9ARAC|nr:hypothetical protein CDAR_256101 [Caerostris darwini]
MDVYKTMENQIKELQARMEGIEAAASDNSIEIVQKLEEKVLGLESVMDKRRSRHSEITENARKLDRHVKELQFKVEEDRKNYDRVQDLVAQLQEKVKTYKKQSEETEEIAALNLDKLRKAQQELEDVEERCVIAENTIAKFN